MPQSSQPIAPARPFVTLAIPPADVVTYKLSLI